MGIDQLVEDQAPNPLGALVQPLKRGGLVIGDAPAMQRACADWRALTLLRRDVAGHGSKIFRIERRGAGLVVKSDLRMTGAAQINPDIPVTVPVTHDMQEGFLDTHQACQGLIVASF